MDEQQRESIFQFMADRTKAGLDASFACGAVQMAVNRIMNENAKRLYGDYLRCFTPSGG